MIKSKLRVRNNLMIAVVEEEQKFSQELDVVSYIVSESFIVA